MANSEANEIPSEVIYSVIRETVENKLNSKKCKIEIKSASQAGASNFVGIVYRATFCKEGESESEKNPIQKMIVKVAPMHSVRRELFISRPAFLREIYMYEKVSNCKNLIKCEFNYYTKLLECVCLFYTSNRFCRISVNLSNRKA